MSEKWQEVLEIVVDTITLSVEDVLRLACVNLEFRRLREAMFRPLRTVELNVHTCATVLQIVTASEPTGCLFPEAENITFVNLRNSLFFASIRCLSQCIMPSKLRCLNLMGAWETPLEQYPSAEDDQCAGVLRGYACPNLESIRVELEYPYNGPLASWFVSVMAFHPPQHLRRLSWRLGVRPPPLAESLEVLTSTFVWTNLGAILRNAVTGMNTVQDQLSSLFHMTNLKTLTVPARLGVVSFLNSCVVCGDLPALQDLSLIAGPGVEMDVAHATPHSIVSFLNVLGGRPVGGLRRLLIVGIPLPISCWQSGSCHGCLMHCAADTGFSGFAQLEAFVCMKVSGVGEFLGVIELVASIPNLREFVLSEADGCTQLRKLQHSNTTALELQTMVLANAQLQDEQLDILSTFLTQGFAPQLVDLAINGNAFSTTSLDSLVKHCPGTCQIHIDTMYAEVCDQHACLVPQSKKVWQQHWFKATDAHELIGHFPSHGSPSSYLE